MGDEWKVYFWLLLPQKWAQEVMRPAGENAVCHREKKTRHNVARKLFRLSSHLRPRIPLNHRDPRGAAYDQTHINRPSTKLGCLKNHMCFHLWREQGDNSRSAKFGAIGKFYLSCFCENNPITNWWLLIMPTSSSLAVFVATQGLLDGPWLCCTCSVTGWHPGCFIHLDLHRFSFFSRVHSS